MISTLKKLRPAKVRTALRWIEVSRGLSRAPQHEGGGW